MTTPKTAKIVVKLSPDEKQAVLEFADRQCVNVSALVRKLLLAHIEPSTSTKLWWSRDAKTPPHI